MAQSNSSASFFTDLAAIRSAQGSFGTSSFKQAPDDWAVVATDIVGSTNHISNGRHKAVNFVAAMAIGALKNLCAPTALPFFFGGDGAVIMVPPTHIEAARSVLARVRGLAARDYQMQLRVGLISVGQLRQFNTDIRVARYEPSPGNNFGLFSGGGVSLLERSIKQQGDATVTEIASIAIELDDKGAVDLNGLSCRWNELASRNGKMVTLIITGASDFAATYAHVQRIASETGDPRPITKENLSISWPPPGLMLEAQARRAGGSIAKATAKVIVETIIAWLIFVSGRTVGGFNPVNYRQEIVSNNTDFCLYDDTLCFVLDCADTRVDQIRQYLESLAADGELQFGMHVSTTALMTCLVTSPTDNLHVHFVDGGSGGYTEAARTLKAAEKP